MTRGYFLTKDEVALALVEFVQRREHLAAGSTYVIYGAGKFQDGMQTFGALAGSDWVAEVEIRPLQKGGDS